MPDSITLPLLSLLIDLSGRLGRLESENDYLREEVRLAEAAKRQMERRLGMAGPSPGAGGAVLTRADLRRIEREALVRALDAADWQVAGPRGAAALLGMRPTTLASRIKALGLTRRARQASSPGIPEF